MAVTLNRPITRMRRVVVVTGANSGIGLALCERLLSQDDQIHLCLACRSIKKAEIARSNLLLYHPSAELSILHIDMGSLKSVEQGAKNLKERNAINMFATGEGLLTQSDRVTEDGLQEVFQTNVAGHFLLVKELETLLCNRDHPSQVIWTSSSNARKSAFTLSDYQHSQGQESYSSSKYATDLLSVALNKNYNKEGMYSAVVCPGLVMTNLTFGILPSLLWTVIMPILWLIRVVTNSFTISPCNGAEALVWLFSQRPESLDPLVKYHSCTTGLGNNYVKPLKMDIDEASSDLLYKKLLELAIQIKKKALHDNQ